MGTVATTIDNEENSGEILCAALSEVQYYLKYIAWLKNDWI